MSETAGELTATGATNLRVQLRKRRADQWTKARRSVFLDHLAATCNVTYSARAAGISAANAHALRRRDPAFADLWSQALQAGYETIEAQLLAQTIGQNLGGQNLSGSNPVALLEISPEAIGIDGMGGPFDPDMALRVLAMRNGMIAAGGRLKRGPAGKRASIEEVRAVLIKKLAALDKRLRDAGAKS